MKAVDDMVLHQLDLCLLNALYIYNFYIMHACINSLYVNYLSIFGHGQRLGVFSNNFYLKNSFLNHTHILMLVLNLLFSKIDDECFPV